MKSIDVVILTDKRYIHPVANNEYVNNAILEDQILQEALEKEDLKVKRLPWDDADFNWNTTRYIIFRSTWDYSNRFEEFSTWLSKVSQQTILVNSQKIIHWNIDKHYLLDIAKKEVEIVPTHFIKQGDERTLEEIHNELGWTETVLKPCISCAGRHTYKLDAQNYEQYETLFTELIADEDMMLQPFMHQIISKGEISVMVMNGKYTHAILKKAKKGDFRVQDDFGGSVHEYNASKAEIELAEKAVQACIELPMYARVDIVWDNQDQLAVSELELIEPELWFRFHNDAATQLAKALKAQLLLLS
jgi:glutathione synthase/RimK-type ligase-like ATP-grasp enzyme